MQEKEDQLSGLMSKSKLELPFTDFENNTMKRIQTELKYRTSILRNFRISALFFILGTGFGLIINSMLSDVNSSILGISSEKFLFAFQLIFVFIVITQSENIFRLFTKLKE